MGVYLWTPTATETFTVSTLGSYTNLYKSGGKIASITATGTVELANNKQFYLRIHTAQSETNGMYGYCFDMYSSANRWDLQLVVNNAWSTLHTGGSGTLTSSNTFSLTIGKEEGVLTLNNGTATITYTTMEKDRIAEIFSSSTPYFFTNGLNVTTFSNTITVTYEDI